MIRHRRQTERGNQRKRSNEIKVRGEREKKKQRETVLVNSLNFFLPFSIFLCLSNFDFLFSFLPSSLSPSL
jgi:hypothetical protein